MATVSNHVPAAASAERFPVLGQLSRHRAVESHPMVRNMVLNMREQNGGDGCDPGTGGGEGG